MSIMVPPPVWIRYAGMLSTLADLLIVSTLTADLTSFGRID